MNERFFVPSDGLQIAVEAVGTGRPFIWAHGLSGWRQSGINKFPHLTDQYRLLAFDQRGHNDSSPVTDPALYDVRRMAGDIGAILDHQGLDQAIIGGESMGAATALTFALQHPERVTALLLLAPAFGDQPNAQREVFVEGGRFLREQGMAAYLAKTAVEQRELGMPESLISYLADVRGSHQADSLATAFLTVIDWVLFPDLTPLTTLDLPVLLVPWPDDPLHPLALAERMAAALPNAQLEIYPSILEFFQNPTAIGDICHRFLAQI